ncbi:MAG: hypothetical protein V2I24_09280 [Halieaceae bacterium]|jgi:hypothetical protein|nr:hypothetical protein [Halieaceae bacterium]
MPTPLECIAIKARKGTVNQALVDELLDMAEQMRVGGAATDALIEADRLIRNLEDRLQTREIQTSLQFAAYNRITKYQADMEQRATSRRADRGQEIMRSIITRDPRAEFASSDLPNIETLRNVIRGRAHALFASGLENLRSKYLGLKQERVLAQDVLRALYDENAPVSQVAKDIAKQWQRVDNYLVRRAKAAGFDIKERRDWRVPQTHDTIAIRYAAGKNVPPGDPRHREAWKDAIRGKLDQSKIISRRTGQAVTDTELDELLDEVFENISTNGLNAIGNLRVGSGKRRPARLADRHSEERVLVFKDADSQISYDEQFGSGGDYFSLMVGHIDRRATEIAAVQTLGPNPDLTLDLMYQRARAIDNGRDPVAMMNDYKELMGRAESPWGPRFAGFSRAVRNVLVASQLGGAFISALSDTAFVSMTAHFNGMNAGKVFGRQVSRYIRGAFDKEDRLFAVRMGLVAEEAAGSAISAGRVVGEFTGAGVTRRMADFVMRSTLLSSWTQVGRHSFGLEMLGHLADQSGKAFDQLDEPLRRSLAMRGVNATDWDIARKAAPRERNGVKFMDFDSIAEVDFNVAAKIQATVLEEMEFAIPSSSVRTRSALKGGIFGSEITRSGTFWGEMMRNTGMYKSFPVTLMYTHMARAGVTPRTLIGQDLVKVKAGYLAPMIFMTTVLGAMSLNSKAWLAGKEPIDPFNPEDATQATKFWLAAMVQGGGLGLFGDFLFSDHSRFGKTFTQSVIGPAYSALDDVVRLAQNAAVTGATGDGSNVGRELSRIVSNYTPGSNIWYARLVLEREVFDWLQETLDPEAQDSFRQKANRAQRDFGTPFWYAPGQHSGINPLRD